MPLRPSPTLPLRSGSAVELLAPGGSKESVEVAMASGADAVYVGVGSANARVRAQNFTVEHLPELVRYVHSFGARLHIPLNVPLTLGNIDSTLDVLSRGYIFGADAVIVRDEALVRAARAVVPDMPVHISTQAGVASVSRARHFQGIGASRVILPRELSRGHIAELRRALPGLELEVFLFGAMCFGFSGACLMGEAVSGRSGNYGGCSQPCRLAYVSPEGQRVGRPFSMRDLDLIPHIPELVGAGVSSLKIEGRLKSPAYVGCVVSWARRALDAGGLSKEEYSQFDRDISVLYSRPRGPGYFSGESDWSRLVAPNSSGHTGLPVSEWRMVSDRDGTRLGLVPPVDIGLRDGLLLLVRSGGEVEERPYSIPALWSGRDRGLPLARAGRYVEIPLPGSWQVSGVSVHSSDAVASRYGRVDRGMRQVDDPLADLEPVVFEEVHVASGSVWLRVGFGRYVQESRLSLGAVPATGRGFDGEMAARYFGSHCKFDIEPGLYINPSELKAVRRRVVQDFWEGALREAGVLKAGLRRRLEEENWKEPIPDGQLALEHAAAHSWVTGFPHGEVISEGGTRFAVRSKGERTVVEWIPEK